MPPKRKAPAATAPKTSRAKEAKTDLTSENPPEVNEIIGAGNGHATATTGSTDLAPLERLKEARNKLGRDLTKAEKRDLGLLGVSSRDNESPPPAPAPKAKKAVQLQSTAHEPSSAEPVSVQRSSVHLPASITAEPSGERVANGENPPVETHAPEHAASANGEASREKSNTADQSKKTARSKLKHDLLYARCIEAKAVGDTFTLKDLQAFGITEDEKELLQVSQELVHQLLFVAMTLNRGLMYRTRSKKTAIQLAPLPREVFLVYGVIEAAGDSGVWRRPLESRTNLHQSNVSKAIKELTAAKLIKEYKSAETSRRVWLPYDVKPNEKTLGGAFIDDGKFDDGMIDAISVFATRFIESQSWYELPPEPKEKRSKSSAAKIPHPPTRPVDKPTEGLTNGHHASETPAPTADQTPALPDPPKKPKRERKLYSTHRGRQGGLLIPHHPTFDKYPTALDVMVELNETRIVHITLTQDDVQQVLNKLEFDGYIEHVRTPDSLNLREGYRSARKVWKSIKPNESSRFFGPVEPSVDGWLPGNGLSQTPCGRCPVFEQCRPGGVVNPEECVYMEEWLDF